MKYCDDGAADQVDAELRAFAALVKDEGVRSYLEVGSQHGGSLWRVAEHLPAHSRIVSVDLPHGDGRTLASLRDCVDALTLSGHDAHLIVGSSTDPVVIEKARTLGPYDCVFIDANHTLPYVKQDWDNYRGMTRNMMAFHDIAWTKPTRPGRLPIEVSVFWQAIRQEHRHVEFVAHESDKGIGVLWPN